ncbi:hypothetical protein B0H13DRAFT_2127061 [Mycena leptocephala]|nr:hypothetical protein B0H13DRAFT_2127061 [Mycena leptocephala]
MSSVTSIPELLLQIFEHLSLRDLISATHVNQQWRLLVPKIDSPTRLRLLSLAFNDVDSPHPISLDVRTSYVHKVEKVETNYNILIPEPYRTILTEWPTSQPPRGMHWPHSVRFHASGFCFCQRHMHWTSDECRCADNTEVWNVELTLFDETFRRVVLEGVLPLETDFELFNNPVRLHTDAQNAQTMRFIRTHPAEGFQWKERWARFAFRVLRLSRYQFDTAEGNSDGTFVMMLDGPTRGQIHAWSSESWYDGYEAEDFWEWNYLEWEQAAVNLTRRVSTSTVSESTEDESTDSESE